MIDYSAILVSLYSDKVWTITGNDYKGINWLDESSKPTQKKLDSLWETVQKNIEAEAKAKRDAKASAIAKLANLGLTVEEVEVAFGLKDED